MATTINGVLLNKQVVESKSFWSSIKEFTNQAVDYTTKVSKDAYEYTSKVTTETVLPVVKDGVSNAAKYADQGVDLALKHANPILAAGWDYVEEKLKANPAVAKTMAPLTTVKAYAVAAVEGSNSVVTANDK